MRAAILKIARDAYRAIGAEGFARIDFLVAASRSSCPRSTRSPASPRSASSRRCRPTAGSIRGRLREGRRPRPRAPRGLAARRLTAGRPAAMSLPRWRAATRRYRTAAGTPRRRPRVRRASARLTPIRAAAILAMLVSAGRRSTASPRRPSSASSQLDDHRQRRDRRPTRSATRSISPPGTNLVGLATGPIVERALGSRRSRSAVGVGRAARRRCGSTIEGAQARRRLGGRRSPLRRRRRRARCSPSSAPTSPRIAGAAGRRRRADARGRARGSGRASIRSTSTPPRGWRRSPGADRQPRPAARRDGHRREGVHAQRGSGGCGPRSSASTDRASGRRP